MKNAKFNVHAVGSHSPQLEVNLLLCYTSVLHAVYLHEGNLTYYDT